MKSNIVDTTPNILLIQENGSQKQVPNNPQNRLIYGTHDIDKDIDFQSILQSNEHLTKTINEITLISPKESAINILLNSSSQSYSTDVLQNTLGKKNNLLELLEEYIDNSKTIEEIFSVNPESICIDFSNEVTLKKFVNLYEDVSDIHITEEGIDINDTYFVYWSGIAIKTSDKSVVTTIPGIKTQIDFGGEIYYYKNSFSDPELFLIQFITYLLDKSDKNEVQSQLVKNIYKG